MAAHQPAAVRFFATDSPALSRTLRARLEKCQVEHAGHVAGGLAQDWPDYKQRIGVIAGLQEAIDICMQIESEQNGDR